MKHTPGPWTVEPFVTPERDDDPMGVYRIEQAETELTARYFAAEPETPELDVVHAENQANARLIAAAPELLELLREAHVAVDASYLDFLEKDANGLECQHLFELKERIGAAIAKALGE
jgi:hypothetical protein